MRWLIRPNLTLVMLACLLGLSFNFPRFAQADVSPELVGIWQRDLTTDSGGHVTLNTDISSDGTMKDWVGNEAANRENGRIDTKAGSPASYHLEFDSGSKDDGTYEVVNHTELRFTNSTGTSVYHRAAAFLDAPPADMPLMLKSSQPLPRALLKSRAAVGQRLWPERAQNGDLISVELEKAAELADAGQWADALPLLKNGYVEWIRDIAFLELAGRVRLETSDFEAARADFDRALMSRPDLVSAYLGRALAAGRLGSVLRMRADLAIARGLDASQADAFVAAHQKEINSIESSQPTQSPDQLCGRLMKLAIDGGDIPTLLPIAIDLYKTTNAIRRMPMERYEDGVRLRSAAIQANPNDAQAWADLATYIYLESPEKYGRGHTDGIEWVNDMLLSMRFADQALALDPRNLSAMATKGWLLEQDNQERDALDLAQLGLQYAPGYPRFAKLQSILLNVSAIRAGNEAGRQRAPKTWTVETPDWITVYTRGPNEQELQAARQFDTMSAGNTSQANQGEFQAWQRYQGSIAEMNVAAGYYDWIGQDDKAVALWNQILKLDPEDETALIDLEDYDKDHDLIDQEFEARFRLENVFATTAKALTDKAAGELVARDFDRANQDLTRALATDPTDTLIYALLGRWAMATKDASAWWPYARCGEAIALAGAQLGGADFSPGATSALTEQQARGILNIWNGELKVATHDGLNDEAAKYQKLIADLTARVPVAPAAAPNVAAASQLAQRRADERIEVLINDNEMDAAAKFCLSGVTGEGAWHGEARGRRIDVIYPIYLYLRPRLYHFQLWHYFGPGTLESFEAYAQSHTGIDPNNPPSRGNHPDAAR